MSLPRETVLRAEVTAVAHSRAQAVAELEELVEAPWRIGPLEAIEINVLAMPMDQVNGLWEARTSVACTYGELLEALHVA